MTERCRWQQISVRVVHAEAKLIADRPVRPKILGHGRMNDWNTVEVEGELHSACMS
jgi:hypothetical protein